MAMGLLEWGSCCSLVFFFFFVSFVGVADGIWGGKWAMGGVYLIAFARQTAGKIKRRNGIL